MLVYAQGHLKLVPIKHSSTFYKASGNYICKYLKYKSSFALEDRRADSSHRSKHRDHAAGLHRVIIIREFELRNCVHKVLK